MNRLLNRLAGGDLRSIGDANALVRQVQSQNQFDKLFEGLFHQDRLIVMRAADAIEKITLNQQSYLEPHKHSVIGLLNSATNKELKWHLALIVSRLKLTRSELGKVWETLSHWALDRSESRIVRVNSVQALFDLLKHSPRLRDDLEFTLSRLEREQVPSIKARIKKLRRHCG